MEYTITSTDAKHFNRIKVNLPQPTWKYSNVMITSFIANCNILVLKIGDYIEFDINGATHKLIITSNVTDIRGARTFIATLPAISNINTIPIQFTVRTDERISIHSNQTFTIKDMSYNFKLILGLYYDIQFPITSEYNGTTYSYDIQAIGYFLSTPVLYLLSNLGGVNYFNMSNQHYKIDANSISMRMLNSFTASMPIISSNAEFSKITLSSDLTDFEIILVDANLQEVDILNPVYITINISNASESMTLEDLERYEYTRKINKDAEIARLQMIKARYMSLNKEVQGDVEQVMQPLS